MDIPKDIKLFLVDVEITVDNIPVLAVTQKDAEEVAMNHFEEEMEVASNHGGGVWAKEVKDKAFLSKYLHDCLPYRDAVNIEEELTCKEFVEWKMGKIQEEKDFAEADKKQVKFDFYDLAENKNK